MLENLDSSLTQNEFLYEMAVHTVDTNKFSILYDNIGNDTTSYTIWLEQYNEVRYMAYDTTKVKPALTFGLDAFDEVIVNNKVPLGLIHINFNRLKSDALTTGDYFDFDLANDKVYDLTNRLNEPYDFDEVGTMTPLTGSATSLNVDFVIDKSWFIYDSKNSIYYDDPGYVFVIDFGNNDTLVTFEADQTHHFTKIYSSGGEKIITVKLYPQGLPYGDPIFTSKSRIRVPDNLPDGATGTNISRDGLDIKIVPPCFSPISNNSRKIAIVLEGFDLFDNQTTDNLYTQVVNSTQMDELRKFGYEFHLISWKQSKIDMRTNADYLIQYMDELKCDLLSNGYNDPMVLMGHSMGGIIGKYALTKWENTPTVSNCSIDYIHFTRLLITLDSPHQGANIPLAYQHFYKELEPLLKSKLMTIAKKIVDERVRAGLLNSVAAKQLLMYHVDTKSSSNYTAHAERQTFISSLNSIGGAPIYCKTVYTSSGSASGQRQLNPHTNDPRTPGDKFLQVDGTSYGRIMFAVVPFTAVDLQMNSAGSSNQIFRLYSVQSVFKLKLKVFGLKLITKTPLSPLRVANASIRSYDVESGGIAGTIDAFAPGFKRSGWPAKNIPVLYSFSYSVALGPGKWFAGAEAGIGFVAGIGASAIVQSDGFEFCFVPTRSALDYGGDILLGPRSPNIETTNAATVMNNTPADVVLAVPDRQINPLTLAINKKHDDLYNPPLFWDYNTDTIFFRTCSNEGYNRVSYLLNREIGDEQLYLENFDQAFPFAKYRSEIDIFVNVRNPAYNYPSFKDFFQNEPGAFSDDKPFTAEAPAQVEFVSDESYAQTFTGRDYSDGFLYNNPQADDWMYTLAQLYICCSPDPNLRKRNIEAIESPKLLNAYFTHRIGNNQYLQVESKEPTNQQVNYTLYDINGRILNNGRWIWNDAGEYNFNSPTLKGIYLLRIRIENKVTTLKHINAL